MFDEKNKDKNSLSKGKLEKEKSSTVFVFGILTSIFILFAFVYVNSEILNNRIEAATSGNTTHLSSNSTAIKTSLNKTANNKTVIPTIKGNTNKTRNKNNVTNSSSTQPNSNVSRLTTTQGNITYNANAPGSPFPLKEANSTSYFPTTNKVAIVLGAALLREKAYQPNPVNVKAGGTVRWNNEDTVVHTVTSGTGLQDPHLGNEFDSGLMGGHFSHIFFKAGVFPYFCQIHPTMVGKVIVK